MQRQCRHPIACSTLYGTLHYQPHASDHNSVAPVNYNGQFNNCSDIDPFLQSFRPEGAKAEAAFHFRTEDIAGARNQQSPAISEQLHAKVGREGNLDARILLGIAVFTVQLVKLGENSAVDTTSVIIYNHQNYSIILSIIISKKRNKKIGKIHYFWEQGGKHFSLSTHDLSYLCHRI